MSDINNKERWHSYGCLLYFRGGHSRNLHEKGSHPSIGCALLFGNGICHSFQYCMEDLKHASHGLVDMTELQNDAIMVATLAPMEAHIASFTMVWHSKPTLGDGELHTPPQQTPPSGGTLHHLQVELGDLHDHELQQLVEDLTQEIAQYKLTVPPATPSK